MVVMFADIRGFTSLAEDMAPEAMGAALAEFRGRVADAPEWRDLPAMALRGRTHAIDVRAYGPAVS
ncbi:MAG: hypothetical protein ACK5YI_12700 [Rhodospirillales bacterium]